MIVRRLIVGLIALLVAVQLVRSAVVQALAARRPASAAQVWSGHPDAELEAGLTAIATAARERRPIPQHVLDEIMDAAGNEPLAPEPYLVRGVQAQLAGDTRTAEQAFAAAERRDGRSLPARYFLAELYFRRGDLGRALNEVGPLARLAPNGIPSLAPYVAKYAKNRSAWPRLKALFRSEPALEEATLAALATDPGNADTVLALADRSRSGPSSPWVTPLLDSLVKAGQYARARDIWAMVSRVQLDRRALVFDPEFIRSGPPAPFNWTLTSSTVGLAERQRGAGLHVIFYGQEDGALASELILLAPGRYRLATNMAGAPGNGDSLQWALTCGAGKGAFASIPLSEAAARPWIFNVPADCPSQRLELIGSSSDIPKQSEARIRSISVVVEAPNG